MLPQSLIVAGALIFGLLGTLHLAYTFFTGKFSPRDAATEAAMKLTHPRLTRRTTLWKAWVGFNASHSLGAMLFAAVYLLLALAHMDWLREAPGLVWLAAAGALAYLALAVRYWFRTPLIGIALASACFFAAAIALSV
jgi:hypothetical protein